MAPAGAAALRRSTVEDGTQVEFDSAGVVFEPTGQAAPTRIILTRDRRSSTVSVDIAAT